MKERLIINGIDFDEKLERLHCLLYLKIDRIVEYEKRKTPEEILMIFKRTGMLIRREQHIIKYFPPNV